MTRLTRLTRLTRMTSLTRMTRMTSRLTRLPCPAGPARGRGGIAAVAAVAAVLSAPAIAEPLPVAIPERTEPVGFQADVLPFLAANCLACHNAGTKEGGLSLETVAAIRAGGDSGPAVVAGKPDESVLLIRAAHRDAEADAMPPQGNTVGGRNLAPQELGLLARWIAEGAAAGTAVVAGPIDWRPLPAGTGPVLALDVTADGRLLAAARGGRVSLIDAVSATAVGKLVDDTIPAGADGPDLAHRDPLGAVAFAAAGDRLATGSFRTIKLWRREPPAILPLAETAPATALAVSADGRRAALGMPDGGIAIVEVDSGRTLGKPAVHDAAVAGLCFAADGATLYSLAASGQVAATSVADGTTTGRLTRPAGTAAIAAIDADRLATAEPDNVVRIWPLPLPPAAAGDGPAAPPMPVKELAGAGRPVAALAPLPTLPGHVVAGGGDGKARLWNVTAGSVVREFDHGGPIAALAVRPDGSRLATAGSIPGVRLWNLADGKLLAEPRGDVRLARRLAAAEVGLAVDRQDAEFAQAEAEAAEKDVGGAAEEKQKTAAGVAAAEKTLAEKVAAAAAAEKAKVEADAALEGARGAVPLAEGAHAASLQAQAAAAAAVETAAASLAAFTKAGGDGEVLKAAEAAAAAARTAKGAADAAVTQAAGQIERAKGKLPAAEKTVTDARAALDKAAEERTRAETAVTSAKRAVEFAAARDVRAREDLPRRKAELEAARKRLAAADEARAALEMEAAASARPVTAVAFSAGGGRLAALEADGRLAILGAADGGIRDLFDAARPAGGSGLVAFAGERLVVAAAGTGATRWDPAERWVLERTIGGEATPPAADDDPGGPPVGPVTALAFSPDGTLLASGSGRASRSGEIKLWNVANGMLARSLAAPHSDSVMTLAFSRRGDLVASGAADRFVKVHAVADGGMVRSFEGHTGHVLGVAWQANGRRLASAGADQAVKIWDLVAGQQQRTITGPRKEVTGVRFLAASDELVTAAGDPLVRVYNVASGAVVRDFAGAGEFVQALAVGPTFAAAAGQDGRVRLWNLADAKPLDTVEVAPRP